MSGAVSGPIVDDKLLFRVIRRVQGQRRQHREHLPRHEKVDFFESKDVRARLLILPTESLTIDVRGSWSDIDGGAVMDASMDPALQAMPIAKCCRVPIFSAPASGESTMPP